MAVPRTIRRYRLRECQLRRDQLRCDQARRDQERNLKLRNTLRRHKWTERIEGALVLAAIISLFGLVYWLAVSDMVPAAY